MTPKDELKNQLLGFQQRQTRKAAELLPEWNGALIRLFKQMAAWLSDLVAQNLLRVEENVVALTEEGLGQYEAPAMKIIVTKGKAVYVVPKARLVLGTDGRVDFECSPNRAILLRRGNDWYFGHLAPKQGAWQFEPLNEDSFWRTLHKLLS